MLKDKDIETFVSELPKNCTVLACNLGSERSATSEYISTVCGKLGIKCEQYESVDEAILSVNDEKTLITGSFYTVAEARTYLKLEGYSEL